MRSGIQVTYVILIIMMLCLFPEKAYALNIEITAETDRTSLSRDDLLTLSVTVKGDFQALPDPEIPSLSDFVLRSQFHSENIEIINFQTSRSITYQYILQPKRTGTITIKPISVTFNGKKYETSAIEIEVTKNAGGISMPPTPSVQPSFPSIKSPLSFPTQNLPFNIIQPSGEIVATGKLDKEAAYVNEQVILTVMFCYPSGVDVKRRLIPPASHGFLIEELTPSHKYTLREKNYEVEEIKFLINPIHPGTCTIGAVTIDYQLEDFFGSNGQVETEPFTLDVRALPEKAPPNFIHGAGKLDIEATLKPESTPMDEPVTLVITVKGEGALPTIELPELPELNNFKKFDTTDSHKILETSPGVIGEKVFKTTLVPQKEGILDLPSLSFSYFDTEKKEYRELITKALNVSVTPAQRKNISQPSVSTPGAPDNIPKADIRYIKSAFKSTSDSPIYKNAYFLFFQTLPLILLALLTVRIRVKERIEKDPAARKKSLAYRNFRTNLAIARQCLKKKDTKAFHTSLYKSIIDYLGDKCNVPGTGLTLQDIKDRLKEKQFPGDKLSELEEIMKTCDISRFSPNESMDHQCETHISKILQLVNLMEKKLS